MKQFRLTGKVNGVDGITGINGTIIDATAENAVGLKKLIAWGMAKEVVKPVPQTPVPVEEHDDFEDDDEVELGDDLVDIDVDDSIEDLELNPRFTQALADAGIVTVGQLRGVDLQKSPA